MQYGDCFWVNLPSWDKCWESQFPIKNQRVVSVSETVFWARGVLPNKQMYVHYNTMQLFMHKQYFSCFKHKLRECIKCWWCGYFNSFYKNIIAKFVWILVVTCHDFCWIVQSLGGPNITIIQSLSRLTITITQTCVGMLLQFYKA